MSDPPRPRGSPEPSPLAGIDRTDLYGADFYRHAKYYSLVAGQNHPFHAAWFIRNCCIEFGLGSPEVGLELCCGPAFFAIDLVGQGVEMTGVDTSAEMLEVASENAQAHGASLRLVQGDMLEYRHPVPVDVVVNLGVNTSYILTQAEMRKHLGNVAASLRAGGIYVIEMALLTFDDRLTFRRHTPPWLVYEAKPALRVARGSTEDTRVTFHFCGPEIEYDPIRQLIRSHDTILVEGPSGQKKIQRRMHGRIYPPLEFEALVEASGHFELVNCFDEFSLSTKLDGTRPSDRYLAVLRKRPPSPTI